MARHVTVAARQRSLGRGFAPKRQTLCIALATLAIIGMGMGMGLVPSARAASPTIYAPGHGIAVNNPLKYPQGYKHFDYVNPNAPKGGKLVLGAQGTFNSFNTVAAKGTPPGSLGLIYNTLMTTGTEGPLVGYGMLAKKITLSPDRKTMVFALHENARWHDGQPLTAHDVEYSFNLLIAPTSTPLWASYYHEVESVKATKTHEVTVTFANGDNAELPIIIGQFPIFPKHKWEKRDATKTFLDVPLGSGPYKLKSFEAGRFLVYERVQDYWGINHPTEVGMNNFDEVKYDYYKDANVIIESFKAGAIDLRVENISSKWATAYNIDARERGDLILKEFVHQRTQGMQGFAYNTRKAIFQESTVREALSYAFDFEWSNKTLFYGQYMRSNSYFSNSELASKGLPSPAELAILNPLRAMLPPRVFAEEYKAPRTEPGSLRANLRTANKLLDDAGWKLGPDNIRTKNGEKLSFEILLVQQAFERIVLPFSRNLERIGVKTTVRVIDVPSYIERLSAFDYDMIVTSFPQSESPGNEQNEFFGSASANTPRSRNVVGIANPAVDAVIDTLNRVATRDELITAVHALDRVLLWNFYLIPQWHANYDRYAYWNRFGIPDKQPQSGASFITWWVDPVKEKNLVR
ncbi:MAG: extracellular solute-binding protein [Alphaproteobacteria bacterium]|nr:extracellular solute-binding protein [Alphaproteobacteria bacterium]